MRAYEYLGCVMGEQEKGMEWRDTRSLEGSEPSCCRIYTTTSGEQVLRKTGNELKMTVNKRCLGDLYPLADLLLLDALSAWSVESLATASHGPGTLLRRSV